MLSGVPSANPFPGYAHPRSAQAHYVHIQSRRLPGAHPLRAATDLVAPAEGHRRRRGHGGAVGRTSCCARGTTRCCSRRSSASAAASNDARAVRARALRRGRRDAHPSSHKLTLAYIASSGSTSSRSRWTTRARTATCSAGSCGFRGRPRIPTCSASSSPSTSAASAARAWERGAETLRREGSSARASDGWAGIVAKYDGTRRASSWRRRAGPRRDRALRPRS